MQISHHCHFASMNHRCRMSSSVYVASIKNIRTLKMLAREAIVVARPFDLQIILEGISHCSYISIVDARAGEDEWDRMKKRR